MGPPSGIDATAHRTMSGPYTTVAIQSTPGNRGDAVRTVFLLLTRKKSQT